MSGDGFVVRGIITADAISPCPLAVKILKRRRASATSRVPRVAAATRLEEGGSITENDGADGHQTALITHNSGN